MSEVFTDELEQIQRKLKAAGQRARVAFTCDMVVVELRAGEDHTEMWNVIDEVVKTVAPERAWSVEMVSPTKFYVMEAPADGTEVSCDV